MIHLLDTTTNGAEIEFGTPMHCSRPVLIFQIVPAASALPQPKALLYCSARLSAARIRTGS
ncbi:hypothetical protein Cflav_PD4708 [Pedosphaera parvula Ellin514]|uniref:Uncharacterized protein n=1 Tax=Pedosphaera parvula (strain Ellin514) TaxID=320771 RepID=B9XEF4_PEDPL|nr:hypothetical protein Cflav_PD4708 [Pedosphaera parvula Ellin514]